MGNLVPRHEGAGLCSRYWLSPDILVDLEIGWHASGATGCSLRVERSSEFHPFIAQGAGTPSEAPCFTPATWKEERWTIVLLLLAYTRRIPSFTIMDVRILK